MSSPSDKRLTEANLSPDQKSCYSVITTWIQDGFPNIGVEPGILTFSGYAGTGKTTVVGVLALELQRRKLQVAYVAFTGRASSILKRKLLASGAAVTDKMHSDDDRVINGKWGRLFDSLNFRGAPAFVGTIHRLLYRPIINERTEELMGWRKRESLDRDYDLIVTDESSQIGDEMLSDLRNHGVPILAVGDHGQLPPVMASGELMKHPDLRLEKIHRQAEGNPIIRLAHEVRETGKLIPRGSSSLWKIPGFGGDEEAVSFRQKAALNEVLTQAYAEAKSPLDVAILCWTNRTRIRLNSEARKARGLSGPPGVGDLMLCLKNYPPVYNGCRGIVSGVLGEGYSPWLWGLHIEFPEEGIPEDEYATCIAQVNRERPFASVEEFEKIGIEIEAFRDAGVLMDFGYAMTVHKMQGSGVPHVVLYLDRPEEPGNESWARWAYTAATRSASKLTILI